MKSYLALVLLLSVCNISCIGNQRMPSSAPAVISFVFDDLNTSDADVKSIFDEFKFKPSFAIQTNKLNASTAPLYQAYHKEGISILSHSHTHLKMQDPTVSEEEVHSELEDSKEIIESYGIPVAGFVTPYSKMHPAFLPLLDSIYTYAYTTNSDGLFDRSVNKLHLSRYGMEGNISTLDHGIDKITQRIDRAIAKKELLVLYGHSLPSTYLDDHGQPRVNATDLRAILAYLREKVDKGHCMVLTSDDAVTSYYQ